MVIGVKSICRQLQLGISINDSSTPVRVVWNTAGQSQSHHSTSSLSSSSSTRLPSPAMVPGPQCGVLIGYLGLRTFIPCPVSSLLDSVGGVASLLGLVAMCDDSQGLYASLKVVVSAVQTNRSLAAALSGQRGYQTLAMLLAEKAHLVNSHILHLLLSLAGTVDCAGKESALISNLQNLEDLLCDLDVWCEASDEVRRLLLEHFYELVIDNPQQENLAK